jgi:hypothetical protein
MQKVVEVVRVLAVKVSGANDLNRKPHGKWRTVSGKTWVWN